MDRSRIKVRDIAKAIDEVYPVSLAGSWDKNGLMVGDGEIEVQGVVFALDPTLDALDYCVEKGANVLVTHHPVYIEGPDSLDVASSSVAAIIHKAIKCDIALINAHTNLDVAEDAKRTLGEPLGLIYKGDLPSTDDDAISYGALWQMPNDAPLGSFAKMVAHAFKLNIKVYGDPKQKISKVATATGSANGRVEHALAAGADILIGGEIGYHIASDAAQRGLASIALGHDVSEWPLVKLLHEVVAKKTYLAPEKLHIMDTTYLWQTYGDRS